MERSKNITNITSILLLSFGLLASTTLLAVALFASPAEAKPASVLLQEGLYAEEIEGDLEAAIKIYKQVIAEVKAAQQTAAQATYRLGMCYLKKGQEEKAAEYFQQVVSNYSAQKVVVERANKQLEKIRPIDDIISRSYVIHYRAVDQSKDALELLNRNHPKGVKTHHANRYRKNGITINSICTDTKEGKEKIVAVIDGSDELELVKVDSPQSKGNLFEILGGDVCSYLGNKYGEVCAEAGMKKLYSHSHIYFVDGDFVLRMGGMGYIYNWTGKPITENYRISGTMKTNLKYYDIQGNEMDIEIIPDKLRTGYYHVYWNPKEPLGPGEFFNFGWVREGSKQLSKISGGTGYSLTMDNRFGSHCYETFFLVVPEGTVLASQSEEYTKMKNFQGWDIYWWKKEVPPNTGHTVNVVLAGKQGKSFPEFEGCRVKETLKVKVAKPVYEWWMKEPAVTKTIYENSALTINWDVPKELLAKSEVFAVSVLQYGIDIHDYDSSMWFETDIPTTARSTQYGHPWKGVAHKIGTSRKAKSLTTGEYKVFLYAFGNLGSDRSWPTVLKDNLTGVAVAQLTVKPMPYTQISINNIQGDGTIKMKNIIHEKNTSGTPATTKSFINSDFVHVEKMFDNQGRPIEFTARHEGNIYRYNLTFDEAVLPGEAMFYGSEGTITDLIKPVRGSDDEFQYFMTHHPGTDQPTRRIEVFRLPEGAELISTAPPNMQRREKSGRIELYVEKIVPAGGSITTALKYKLSGAELASAEPLKLEPAPWVDGEMLRFNLNTMTGMKIGDIIYTAETAEVEGQSIWRVESYMNVTANKMQQYTRVDAVLDDFAPLFGRTKNQMGDFEAEYGPDKVELTVTAAGKQTTREIRLDSAVYDNEQVLYLIRRMPLQEAYSTQFSIFPVQSGTVTECKITVTGKEKLTVSAGMFDCHAVELTVYVGPIKALEHHLWISADQHQYLVKYDSGQAIVELAEIGLKTATAKKIEFSEYGISLQLPAGWYHMENPTMGVYRFSVQLISPQMESWLVLTGGERASAFDSARTAANMDIEVLKGFFKNYTVREDSWTDLTVDSMPAVSFQADYEDKATQMVECRTYILGKSMIYWFVLRVEEDKFEANRDEFNAIVKSFKLNR